MYLHMKKPVVQKTDPFPRWLRAARASMSQRQSTAAHKIGVSRITFSAWERGVFAPVKVSDLFRLEQWCPEVTAETLLKFLRRYHA